MDLFAYRDDSTFLLRVLFQPGGDCWMVMGALWNKEAVTAKQMAEKMTFHGYELSDYEVALQATVEIGWAR